jgi:hypothetical protein
MLFMAEPAAVTRAGALRQARWNDFGDVGRAPSGGENGFVVTIVSPVRFPCCNRKTLQPYRRGLRREPRERV